MNFELRNYENLKCEFAEILTAESALSRILPFIYPSVPVRVHSNRRFKTGEESGQGRHIFFENVEGERLGFEFESDLHFGRVLKSLSKLLANSPSGVAPLEGFRVCEEFECSEGMETRQLALLAEDPAAETQVIIHFNKSDRDFLLGDDVLVTCELKFHAFAAFEVGFPVNSFALENLCASLSGESLKCTPTFDQICYSGGSLKMQREMISTEEIDDKQSAVVSLSIGKISLKLSDLLALRPSQQLEIEIPSQFECDLILSGTSWAKAKAEFRGSSLILDINEVAGVRIKETLTANDRT